MRISDWSSDVCSSDLLEHVLLCASEIRMHLAYTAEQEALRRELRQYFQALMTPEVENECAAGATGGPASLEAGRQMGRDGWPGRGWPPEGGGQGRTDVEPVGRKEGREQGCEAGEDDVGGG